VTGAMERRGMAVIMIYPHGGQVVTFKWGLGEATYY